MDVLTATPELPARGIERELSEAHRHSLILRRSRFRTSNFRLRTSYFRLAPSSIHKPDAPLQLPRGACRASFKKLRGAHHANDGDGVVIHVVGRVEGFDQDFQAPPGAQ